MDYNLQGLSSRSFEQLVQALAAKVIGPQIIVFGDGPDGGREAVFEGRISYPPDAAWTGYGIVQAKFKQRLQNSAVDGNWAVRQLRSELKSFIHPGNSRRKPEYYIFATNVTLTPVEGDGFKDKLEQVFREFAPQLPLKGHAIWDYDNLRVFLDSNDEIRKGYAAWITPGDVLSEVMTWLKPRPDFQQTLMSFLQKELLSDQYVNLEQAGHSKEESTPIARVFVDLPAFEKNVTEPPVENEADPLAPGIAAQIVQAAAERLDPQSLGITLAEDRVGSKSVNKKGRYVITGGPGQGKTTLSQFICQLFRASILKDLPPLQLDPETQQVLDSIALQVKEEGTPLPTARRFPIRIVLSQFAKSLAATGSPKSLLSYVVELINKRTDRQISADDLRGWLGAYPWIIVFDGLDEVPASSNRDAVLEAIRDFRIDARNCNADMLTIGTTRPQGYNDDFKPELHHHVWLAPLSTTRAMHYAQRLVRVRYGANQDRVEKILGRLERASGNEATIRLMRSPLQVTIMTTLVDRMGQPPQERWNLFKEYYKVIYQREVERDIPAAAILRDYQPDVDTIHSQVGLLLQVESERSGQTDARLSREQFETVVENRLLDEGHHGEDFKELKRQIIEAATDRLVFLVGLETDKVGFEIRSLQEFMAAEGLINGSDDLVRKRLREIAPVSNWRNVFLFAAGKCFSERQHLRDTIQAICAELNEDTADGPVRETLTGSRLALDLLEDGPARRQPKYTQSLTRLALRLLDQPPHIDQVRIANLYESSLDRVYKEEIQLRISQVDHSRRLGAWVTLLSLIETSLDWAVSLAERSWPEDTFSQLDIVTNGVADEGKWHFSKVLEVIPKVSPAIVARHFGDEFLDLVVQDQLPAWLIAVDDLISSDLYLQRSEVSLNDSSAPDVFKLRFLKASGDDVMWGLSGMPNPSAGWLALIDGLRFAQEPSVAELANALEKIFESTDSKTQRWLIRRLPWPLASALAFALEFGLDETKRLALEENLGNSSDWSKAESRWLTSGFGSDDIVYTANHLPFDTQIAQFGFPFASSFSVTIGENLPAVVPVLTSAYRQIKNSYLKSRVADWIIFVLSIISRSKLERQLDEGSVPTLEEFKELITDARVLKETIILDALELRDFGDQLDNTATEFFDWVGRQKLNAYRIETKDSSLPELLAASFLLDPSRVGVLRSLSFWMGQNSTVSLPDDLLQLSRYDDVVFKQAALTVKRLQGNWSADEIVELADSTAQYLSTTPDRPVFFDLDRPKNVSPAIYNSFLLELRKRLPSERWRDDMKILERLGDSVRRRTSSLSDAQTWSELGLPSGLITVLQYRDESA